MSTPHTLKLHLFFARDTDRAVILRQGPSKVFRMILWHRATDRFEDGQWLKHTVYVDRCDLSPDGQHFLYFALDGNWGSPAKGSYTALSRPPYFTALALFPQGHTWAGGGQFVNNTTYVADGDPDIVGRAEGLARIIRTWDRNTGDFRYADPTACPSDLSKFRPVSAQETTQKPAARTDPAYWTKGGNLYRRRGQDLTLIRDFTDMRFAEIRAPYDRRKPGHSGSQPWHPLDGDPA